MEMQGMPLFNINTHNMLYFEAFGLLFNCIAFGSTLLYFYYPAVILKMWVPMSANILLIFLCFAASASSVLQYLADVIYRYRNFSIPLYI
jgi:NADH-quinone oxidoreductase subunit N